MKEQQPVSKLTLAIGAIGVVLVLIGLNSAAVGPVFWGVAALVWAGYKLKTGPAPAKAGRGGLDEALQMMRALPYQHFADKTGIAVDPGQRTLHLLAGGVYKAYSFDDVRTWSTNLHHGGMVYGSGLNVAVANLANARQNAEASGLFLEVRDIDHPLWKIRFPTRKVQECEMLLARWSEILRQHLNEAAQA
jgi:hypothetical protein